MHKFFIGVDISKKSFDASIISREDLSKVVAYKKFQNKAEGFVRFARWIEGWCGKDAREHVLICAENTGVYSEPFADALYADSWCLWIESPLRIKRSLGISRGKDDKQDSRKIAEYAARHEDKAVIYAPLSPNLKALRELLTQRRLYVEQREGINRRMGELKESGISNPILAKSLKMDDDLYKYYKQQIKVIDKQMETIILSDAALRKTYEILTSMKGVALINASALIIYTNNFARFDYDARKICSYWGVAPFAHQSGTSINGTPHVSRFADMYLKRILSESVLSAMLHCPAIKEYARRLKQRGKHPSIVKNNCKNKILHILVAMVKNETKYSDLIYKANKREKIA